MTLATALELIDEQVVVADCALLQPSTGIIVPPASAAASTELTEELAVVPEHPDVDDERGEEHDHDDRDGEEDEDLAGLAGTRCSRCPAAARSLDDHVQGRPG